MGHRIFEAVKLLCMILQLWVHVIIHLSRPIEYTTLRVNPTDFGAVVT